MTTYHQCSHALWALLLATVSAPILAQEAADDPPPQDDLHDRRINAAGEIVVTAAGVGRLDVLAGTSVMEGVELQRNLAGQVGEVLAKLPGVSASSFAPGASRPVLRGFSGERVRVLTDGIGALDASNTSADHAVSLDPLTAERIEVLRGPAVLLYGSQAIGGAVNVIDKRIPRSVPREAIHIDALGGLDTAYNLREVAASVDAPAGGGFAVHVDGSYRRTDDVELAGFAVARPLREQLLAQADAAGDEDLRAAALQRGTLLNSATETTSLGAGAAFFRAGGNLGVAVGYYDTTYGIPSAPGGEEGVSIGLEQFRADMRGTLDLGGGPFATLQTRFGFSDYTHTEFEGDEVGTVFAVKGFEGRLELIQAERDNWRGSIGAQLLHRDFAALGEEAFIPPNLTDQYAIFALQEFDVGPIGVELAGRYERTDVRAASLGISRGFDSVSGAVGAAYETSGNLRFGINASRVARAPGAEELFADGPHLATRAFEIGDPFLATEKAWGLESYVRGQLGPAELSFAVYRNLFDDYIFERATGEEEDGLPVFRIAQQDARYFGVEGEVSLPVYRAEGLTLLADLRGDYVRAELDDGTPLPRIPPVSLLGALEAQTGRFDVRGEVQWSAAQRRIAPFETPTDDFAFVNASIAWKTLRGGDTVTVLLQADNLFDATGRRHASFTKDFVPLAGRNFKLSVRASF